MKVLSPSLTRLATMEGDTLAPRRGSLQGRTDQGKELVTEGRVLNVSTLTPTGQDGRTTKLPGSRTTTATTKRSNDSVQGFDDDSIAQMIAESASSHVNDTTFDIVDHGRDKVDVPITGSSNWKPVIHGRRQIVAAGSVIAIIGLLVLGFSVFNLLLSRNSGEDSDDGENNEEDSLLTRGGGLSDRNSAFIAVSIYCAHNKVSHFRVVVFLPLNTPAAMSRLSGLLQIASSAVKVRVFKKSRCHRRSYSTAANGRIRKAVQSDFDSAVSIDYDVYKGRDFLPSMYPAFIQNPNVHTYVYEIDKNVVAFEAANVVDGGMTIVTRGTRIKEGYQNENIMQRFRNHIKENLARKHSSKFIALTTSNTSGLATNPSFLQHNKEVLRRNVHIFSYQMSDLDVPPQDDFSATRLTQLTTGQLCEMFHKPALSQYLFPHKRFIINAVPFRLMQENMEAIQAENPFILLTDKLKSGPSPPNQGLVSVTTWFSHQDGICVDLEFYGCSSNFPEICNHIRRHLVHVMNLAPPRSASWFHSYTISSDALLCAFSRYGMSPMSSELKTQYLFEESIV
ncbi:hypothetical protein Btru_024807 [Bulinus truncatus]|nr:hypothetical protein Btru_024807 [Bulinus truncatus]